MQLSKRHKRATLNSKPRCFYCGDVLTRRTFSLDHMTPRSKGGSDTRENKVHCCKSCNNEKDDRSVEQYRSFLIEKSGKPLVFFGERSRLR